MRGAVSILVDGPDFAGKSTVCRLVHEELTRRGFATHHAVGSLTSLTDRVYRRLPHAHTRLTARTFPLVLMRDALFLTSPILDALARPFVLRRAAVHLQEGYYDRVWSHHLIRDHRFAAGVAGVLRRLVRFDVRIYLDVTFEESRDRYLESGRTTVSDEVRFGAGADSHRSAMAGFRALAAGNGYRCVAAGALKADEVCDLVVAHITDLIDHDTGRATRPYAER